MAFLNINESGYELLFALLYFLLVYSCFSLLLFVARKAFVLIILLASTLSFYFINSYGVIVNDEMLQNAAQTDIKEVSELLNSDFFLYIFLFFIIPGVVLLYVNLKKLSFKLYVSNALVAVVLLFATLFSSSQFLLPFLRQNDTIRFYNIPFYQFYSAYKYLNQSLSEEKTLKLLAKPLLASKKENMILVLVVGETARAANYSLGSYENNDTNFFIKKHEPYYFSNFYSCGTATARSLPCMFSHLKRKDFYDAQNYENLVDLVANFYEVEWLDNNSGGCKGVCSRVKNTEKSEDYDAWLFEEAKLKIIDAKASKLLVIHVQGSHGPAYYKRYPSSFAKFLPECKTSKLELCTSEEIANSYDNSLLYTDFLLADLIDALKSKEGFQSALFYLSDHGESLGENGIYLHGLPYSLAPNYQKHIPAIFWSNFLEIKAQKLDKSYSHDNLFSSILGLFGMEHEFYEKDLDIFAQ